jgi:hypothetical protein
MELDRELQERMAAVGAFVAEISSDLERQVHRNNQVHFILGSQIGVLKQRARGWIDDADVGQT